MYGFNEFHRNPDVTNFIKLLHDYLSKLLLSRDSFSPAVSKHIDKQILLIGKAVVEIQKHQPLSFGPFLAPFLTLFSNHVVTQATVLHTYYSSNNNTNIEIIEQTTIQALTFLKDVVECDQYSVEYHQSQQEIFENLQISPEKSDLIVQCNQVVTSFFNSTTVVNLCNLIISKLLPMSYSDLAEWSANPEEFEKAAQSDSWQDRVKPCAEALYLKFLGKYRTWLAPQVVQLIQQLLKDNASNNTLPSILLKDACYLAIGLGYYDLYDYVNFEAWFSSDLIKELQSPDPNNKIIVRRIIWLIGSWVGKVPKEFRKGLYGLLINLYTAYSSDVVVALTIANTLKSLIDDVDFYVEPFQEYLDSTIGLLFQLLGKVEECDTKLQVLSVISIIVYQLEDKIVPYAMKLVECFQRLWNEALTEAYNLLKQSIVRTLTNLVQNALPFGSIPDSSGNATVTALLGFVVPLIEHSTNVQSGDSVYLLEDGLALWLATLSQLGQLNDPMLRLFKNVPPLMQMSYENSQTIMKIIEEYIILGNVNFLKLFVNDVVSVFASVVGNVKDRVVLWTLKPMETFIRLFPQEGLQCMESLMQKILSRILTHQDSDLEEAHYLMLFARILSVQPDLLLQFFDKLGQPQLLNQFLEVWLDKTDSMPQMRMTKLSAIALLNLLASKRPEALNYFGLIINLAVSVIQDTRKQSADWFDESYDEEDPKKNSVKEMLYKRDVINTVNVQTYLLQKLQECSMVNGQAVFNQLMQTVDPSVMKQLQTITANQNANDVNSGFTSKPQ
eukprot:CAMPEP_0168548608 /NCGR_PEP_ID=MMETSP0413-20121227/4657_1 /TAXON_ID=136452 /ORGANISM="Filamoeba nolandi, Strain NC-AS-23-1" /LENGTH=782 /DNA_ID=CAMNT_0008578933 /DNA_START=822 /DNA_END=3170 /DNA_ORIENTATION=+